jgi:hypothetical protein
MDGPYFNANLIGLNNQKFASSFTYDYTINGVTAANDGYYYLYLDGGGSGWLGYTSEIFLHISPAILTQPQSTSCLVGSYTTMGIAAGPETATFQWFDAATQNPINAPTNSPAFRPTLANNSERVYCQIINSYGSVNSSSAALSVAQAPTLTAQTGSITTNFGSTVEFIALALGTSPLYYQWLKNGIAIQGANLNYIILQSVTNFDNGTYELAITNAYGGTNSTPSTLNVTALPPQGFSAQIIGRNFIQLNCIGTANYPYALQVATNLAPPVNWQPLGTNNSDDYGLWSFTDSNVAVWPERFYRASAP